MLHVTHWRYPHSRSLILWQCKLPDGHVEKILRQLFGCGESLQRLGLWSMDHKCIESLLDELLEDLVAHHQRKREAGLAQRKFELWLTEEFVILLTDLSEEFKEKWRSRCQDIDSVYCKIHP